MAYKIISAIFFKWISVSKTKKVNLEKLAKMPK